MKKSVIHSLVFALLALVAPVARASAPPASPAAALEAPVDLSGDASFPEANSAPVFSEPAAGVDLLDSASVSVLFQESISPLYTSQVTTAAEHEVETGITALAIGGVDHTVGAFMRKLTNWEIRTRKSTNLTTWTERTPAKPAGATKTVDPVLATNVYTNGVSPLTVYLGGLGTNSINNTRTIVVWRSTDGALTWSAPVTVAQSIFSGRQVDKPAIAVSWYLLTRGHVFVAYIQTNTNRNLNQLYVARSTDGGVTFGVPVLVAESYLHVPQVLVSSATGNVYVAYIDYNLNKIRMATSTNQGSTWTLEDVTGPTGKFLDVNDDKYIPGGGVCKLQAITVPHARFNWVHGSIGIVWHERQTTSTNSYTDVWFIAKTASGWTTKKRVNPNQTNDQWMPALDFDATGNYVVVYYDRSADPADLLFKEAWTQVDPVGTTLASGLVSGAFASNPTVYIGENGDCFKGEYQDIWYWPYSDGTGGRFNSFWTGTTSSTVLDNVYISGLK